MFSRLTLVTGLYDDYILYPYSLVLTPSLQYKLKNDKKHRIFV